jgi:hypothetical protein
MNNSTVLRQVGATVVRLAGMANLLLFATMLTACGGGGAGEGTTGTTSITPTADIKPPTISISANPASIFSGASSVLTWFSTNANSCQASDKWSGSKGTSGSETTNALTATSTFVLTCTGAGGSVARAVTVTVTSPTSPTLSLNADKTFVMSGGSAKLSWTSSNVGSCLASSVPSGIWSGTKSASGSESTGALTSTASFTLDCTGATGSISRSVTVSVSTAPPTGLIVGGYPMPTLEDERNTYRNWGWTWNVNVEPAVVTEPIANYYVTLDPLEVRYDTEADDLWNYVMMYRRTGNTVYLNRAQVWLRYFKDEYRDDLVSGDNFAHLYGVGLIAWYEHTCEQGSCDDSALAAAEGIGVEVEKYWQSMVPGSFSMGYYGPRKGARNLLFATRLAEVTKKQRWIDLRDKLIELWIQSPDWDARGMYFSGREETDNESGLGSGAYAAGYRILSSFQIGIITEAFNQAYRITGRREFRDRLVDMAKFVDQYGLDPGNLYTGSYFGIAPDGSSWHKFEASAYTTSLVNTLVSGYKLTGNRYYYDRAKFFFNRGTKGVYGDPTKRTSPDNVVDHFVDTVFSSDKFYLSYNKGELQYTYMIFENGGMP